MSISPTTWSIGSTDAPLPPRAPGVPFFGNALQLRRDPLRVIVELYHKLGPIFTIKILNQPVTVLAGLDANRLATRHDDEVFTNAIAFEWLRQEVGPVLTSTPPEEHRHNRRLLLPAYRRDVAASQLPTLASVVDRFFDALHVGDTFEVFPTMQELVVNQLGAIMLGEEAGESFADVRNFMRTMLDVYQFHTKPRLVLSLPAYRRAKARSKAMARRILDRLRHGADEQHGKVISALLHGVDRNGQPFSEAQLLSEALGPYLAGQDTVAGTLSFLFYAVHKHGGVQDRIISELHSVLGDGELTLEASRKLQVLHKTIVESMRRYPVAVFMPRHASQPFTFAGYQVNAGAAVYSATAVTHFLPDFYPDPYHFDIDRPRGPSGTFVPFGVGNYACLGAGIAEVQLLATAAALLRRGRFELDPPDYEATMDTIPLPNPGRYRLRLVERFDS